MKQAKKQAFPRGWNEKKVRAVIAHYDRQSDEEGAAEIESAPEAPGETWMRVPNDLVSVINGLIDQYEQKDAPAAARNGRRQSRSRP